MRSSLRTTVLWWLIPAAVLYAVALIWSGAEGISAKFVLRDLAQSCDAPLGQGFLSSVGYLLWMAAAAIALFGAATRQIQGSIVNRQFAFCGGGFSLWLCLDDMFLVHDRYLGEAFLYVTYAVFTGLLLFRFRAPLQRFGGEIFLLAVVLLGASVLTDALQGLWPDSYQTVQIVEEGAKFLGIAAWLSFWCHYVSAASKPARLDP
jgi:hypothetical protein